MSLRHVRQRELFLYLNDDYLFGNHVRLSDFILPDGRIRVMGTLIGERLPWRIHPDSFPSLGFVEHTPLLIYKPYFEAMQRDRSQQLHFTRSNRFRHQQDLSMEKVYRLYLLGLPAARRSIVPFYRLIRDFTFVKVSNHFHRQKKALDRLRKNRPPAMYCLNDDQRSQVDPRVSAVVKEFLEEYYPRSSSYEK